MSLLQKNLAVLKTKYPHIAQKVEDFPDKHNVVIFHAKDGAPAFGLKRNGSVQALTDPIAPLKRLQQQIDLYSKQVQDFTRPLFIVGFYPGLELIQLFERCEKEVTPHCPQPIFLCVDSIANLYCFLQLWDVTHIISSNRVRWFLAEERAMEVEFLRSNPHIPHVATLITGAPDNVLEEIMPPFAKLVIERDEEMKKLQEENERYYDAISDEELAKIIEGKSGRAPRLMMPTCSWSTFVQYSVRDTAREFEEAGWEVKVLKMDAMLTPYYLVKSINEFKPDVFLFIDHMRYEAEEVYPKNMMFITWIQDELPNLHSKKAGEKMREYAKERRRDIVIGYTRDLDSKYGFPSDRLIPLPIMADPRIFHPIELTEEDKAKYGCDLAFVSNVSMDSRDVIEKRILPQVEPLGISKDTCFAIHDDLWKIYRAEKTMTDRAKFCEWLRQYDEFDKAYVALEDGNFKDRHDLSIKNADELLNLFYWRLNDTIYRHVVLEWADEYAEAHPGFKIHLYGRGWERHPRFKKYAKGPIEHGAELNRVYQAAKLNLHLNITEGMHQRLWEIAMSGTKAITRKEIIDKNSVLSKIIILKSMFLNDTRYNRMNYSNRIQKYIYDFLFNLIMAGKANHYNTLTILLSIYNAILEDILCVFKKNICFGDKMTFIELLNQPYRQDIPNIRRDVYNIMINNKILYFIKMGVLERESTLLLPQPLSFFLDIVEKILSNSAIKIQPEAVGIMSHKSLAIIHNLLWNAGRKDYARSIMKIIDINKLPYNERNLIIRNKLYLGFKKESLKDVQCHLRFDNNIVSKYLYEYVSEYTIFDQSNISFFDDYKRENFLPGIILHAQKLHFRGQFIAARCILEDFISDNKIFREELDSYRLNMIYNLALVERSMGNYSAFFKYIKYLLDCGAYSDWRGIIDYSMTLKLLKDTNFISVLKSGLTNKSDGNISLPLYNLMVLQKTDCNVRKSLLNCANKIFWADIFSIWLKLIVSLLCLKNKHIKGLKLMKIVLSDCWFCDRDAKDKIWIAFLTHYRLNQKDLKRALIPTDLSPYFFKFFNVDNYYVQLFSDSFGMINSLRDASLS